MDYLLSVLFVPLAKLAFETKMPIADGDSGIMSK